ncbi:MAG TPA: YidC/Oxa1 family membrane protein insertase [Anaerolineae bacterium]|nr:YidC/Oxa1 family membrane protein insertase [Anaerolineae bacterium]
MGITDIWTVAILQPMLNALLWLYDVLGDQFWLAIIVFTVFIRGLMTPLMLPQQRSAKKMQEIQPRLQELQKKYGKDRERLSQEQMKLYREAGVNPMGGCLPLLIQFPIWIGLYQSIIQALGYQPLQLLSLSGNIYPFLKGIWTAVPLNRYFLGMDLALTPQQLGGLTYALPVLVAFTSWLQTKMTGTTAGGEGQAASMNQSMTLMMPLMFGFFSLNFSTGLSFYFIVSNVIGIITQGFISGWEGLLFWKGFSLSNLFSGGTRAKPASPQDTSAKQPRPTPTASQKGTKSGSNKRKKKRRRKR